MSTKTARNALSEYLDALVARGDYARFFTEDVEVSLVGTPQHARGPEAAEQMLRFMHEVAFDANPEVKNVLVDEDKAALEADFVGTHTGEFAGIAATGKRVRVPYSVIYDLQDDRISALRIYLPPEQIVEQLGRDSTGD
jgi:predicted ester cyclase